MQPIRKSLYMLHACLLGGALLLAGCGGGGSDSDLGSQPGSDEPSSTTGTIAVTMGDDPTQAYDEILLTVTEVTLQGSGEPIVLLNEDITVSLLELDSATEVLALAEEVPTGQYNRLMLQVSRIELNKLDDEGNVAESHDARVLANGRVMLNPRSTFTLDEGQSLVVQLDMDARRSFQVTQAGASGQLLFRPVVFVDILTPDDTQRVSFLSGNLQLLGGTAGDSAFDLCDFQPISGRDPQTREGCIRVSIVNDPPVVSEQAAPIAFGELTDGDALIVAGRLVPGDGGLEMNAEMIQAGDRESFARVGGTLDGDATAEGFLLTTNEDGSLPVELLPGALLFDHTGALIEVGDLVAGTRVRAMGIIDEHSEEGDTDARPAEDGEPVRVSEMLLATAVGADLRTTGTMMVSGTIESVSNGTVQLLVDGDGLCARGTSETEIIVFESTEDGIGSREGDVSDLEPGLVMEADLSQDMDEEGCMMAISVIVQAADI